MYVAFAWWSHGDFQRQSGLKAPPFKTPNQRVLLSAFKEFEEGGFVEDGHVELAGFVELGAGLFAGDEVVGFLRDGAGDFSAGGFDAGLGVVAGERGERAGEDEGEAGEGGADDALFGGEFEAEGFEVVDELLVLLVGEELDDGVGDARTDFVDCHELIGGGGAELVDGAEVLGEELRGALADEADAEAEEDAGEAAVFAVPDLIEE